MKANLDKTPEQSTKAPQVQQEQSTGGTATIADNRPSIIYQRKLRETMANSPRVQEHASLRTTMNAHAAGKALPIQRKINQTGLPDTLKTGIENLSGYAMDDVKVHYNSNKPAQLQAHAYAQGTDIHIASGQEKHLPHEAWHVVQQKQGRVKPTMQLKGKVNVNDDTGLEREADVMGDKAMHAGFSGMRINTDSNAVQKNTNAVQRKVMPISDLTNAGTSKRRRFGPMRKFRALTLKVDAYHREQDKARKTILLQETLTLCSVWKRKNANKNKPEKLAVVEKLEKQATEELREITDDPELKEVKGKTQVYQPEYTLVDEPLFKPGEPKPEDIRQGYLGDCYLLAVAGSLAAKDPNIIKDMMYDGGDTVTVRLYEGNTARYVKVAKTIPKVSIAENDGEVKFRDPYAKKVLWVQMLEKALAALYGSYEKIESGTGWLGIEILTGGVAKDIVSVGYDPDKAKERKSLYPWPNVVVENASPYGWDGTDKEINQKKNMKREMYPEIFGADANSWQVFVEDPDHNKLLNRMNKLEKFEDYFNKHLNQHIASRAIKYLEDFNVFAGRLGTGKYSREQLKIFSDISSALEKGGALNAGIQGSSGNPKVKGLVRGHQYTILDTKEEKGLKYIEIRNPWGRYSREYVYDENTGEMQPEEAKDDNDGISWIELSDFTDNFNEVSYITMSDLL